MNWLHILGESLMYTGGICLLGWLIGVMAGGGIDDDDRWSS